MRFDDIALKVPRILLPNKNIDLAAWSVIACDQHTSNHAYWNQVSALVGDSPSTLNIVFPEVHLAAPDRSERIASIKENMRHYLEAGVLVEQEPGFVLIERHTASGTRLGLLVALDLEHYDYRKGSRPLIRTTEGTVVERLPPRIEVRRGAVLETPHIVVLIDDPQRQVIEPLRRLDLPPLYDTELMLEGGHLKGWHLSGHKDIEATAAALRGLVQHDPQGQPMLYAMGDGNHSFATAKEVWESVKAEAGGLAGVEDHPARHALVELVNLHDDSLDFAPIHRVVVGTSPELLLDQMVNAGTATGLRCTWEWDFATESGTAAAVSTTDSGHRFPFIGGGRQGVLSVENPQQRLEVATLEALLAGCQGHSIDYIHGDDALNTLGQEPQSVGFYLPGLDKHSLFGAIARDGALPHKTFSVGEAAEKRYYLECRRIEV
jgi:hypothetical protein